MPAKKINISVVVRNAIANYAGNILTALIAFIFIPIYIRCLGIGSYGIIGFFASLQTFLAFLDLGIGMAINREMSRYYHDPSKAEYLRKLSHSLQVVYWAIAAVIGIGLFALSPFLSTHWFKGDEIPHQVLFGAFAILSLTLAVRWPYSLYSSGIRGMQHQVLLNAHDLFWALMKSIGSWVVLKYYSPTLSAFLWYQCIITFLQTFGTFFILWYYMPKVPGKNRFVFDKDVVKQISRYAAGMGVAFLLGSIIMQLDKILVSKMVMPSQFGYYMLATNIATLVYNASLPLYMAIFPHFAKMAYHNEIEKLKTEFHFYSQLMSTIMFPFSAIVFFAAEEVLWLWTKDRTLAYATAPILRIMIAGTTVNALLTTVHTLLIAYNRVRFQLYCHLVACLVMIPMTLLLVHYFGIRGGAWSITTIYTGYFIIQAILIFRLLDLRSLTLRWYMNDILKIWIPVCLFAFVTTHYWLPAPAAWVKSSVLLKLAVIAGGTYVISIFVNESLRSKLTAKLASRRSSPGV